MMANFSSAAMVENSPPKSTDTDIAIAVFISTVVFCLNEVSLYLLIKVVERERELVVGRLLKCFAMFNIICTPLVYIMVYGVIGLSPASVISGHWFCTIAYLASYFCHFYNINFSFMVACMMYVSIVCRDRMNCYRGQFLTNLFCTLSFIIPLVIVVVSIPLPLHQASHNIPWIQKCYGIQQNRGPFLCSFDDNKLDEKYGNWSNAAKLGLQTSCWIDISCLVLLSLNIPDAIFYVIIYFQLKV